MTDQRTLTSPALRITVGASNGVHEVRLSGELDLATAACLRATLARLAGSVIVVDVSRLRFVDCAGMSALALARRRAHAGGFTVRGAQGLVRWVLEAGGFGELLGETAA